jgi:hypothetical protein
VLDNFENECFHKILSAIKNNFWIFQLPIPIRCHLIWCKMTTFCTSLKFLIVLSCLHGRFHITLIDSISKIPKVITRIFILPVSLFNFCLINFYCWSFSQYFIEAYLSEALLLASLNAYTMHWWVPVFVNHRQFFLSL